MFSRLVILRVSRSISLATGVFATSGRDTQSKNPSWFHRTTSRNHASCRPVYCIRGRRSIWCAKN